MSERAATVIVGAGIVGASVAYHLAQLGVTDILVVDQGDVPHNPGSTSHAPGGVVAMSHNRLLALLSFYSTDLYRRLDRYDQFRHTYNPVGSIELARTPERMADLVREHGEALAYGVETTLLEPDQVTERVPYIDASAVTGGLFIPDSAIVSGVGITGALLRDAQTTGAVRTLPNTKVVSVTATDGRVSHIVTEAGDPIEVESVILCTNIWALPELPQPVPLPMQAFEHQYVETADILEGFDPDDPDDEVTVPTVRDMDAALYYRHHWNRLGVGSYNHAPLPVRPEEVGKGAEADFTEEHFRPAWQRALEVIPTLRRSTGYQRAFNGMFAFSVDGMPIIGETATAGLWLAIGSWITHAGGVGKAVAELVTDGEAEWDLREASLDRFHPHQTTRAYVDATTVRNYREVYDIHHPMEPPSRPRDVRRSPLAPSLHPLDPHNGPFGGMELARWYGANEVLLERYADRLPERSAWASLHSSPVAGAEHLACREEAALFDLSGLSIIEVAGPDAASYVSRLCANRVDVAPGRVVYTTWLTPGGGIKRDLTVARLADDRFWMFVGEGTRPQDVAWARRHATDHAVTVTDISDPYAAVGLWGPRAPEVLAEAGSEPGLGYFRAGWIELGPVPVYAMRISYVGEAGYELHFPADQSHRVFEAIWEAGREAGLVMAGSLAMDSLRIEKGYRLWGADIHTEFDPFEAGLDWTVRGGDDDFIGAAAVRRLAQAEPERKLTCLILDSGDPLGNEAVIYDGQPVGRITSAAFGFSVGSGVAFAYLPTSLAVPTTVVEVLVEGVAHRAVVAEDPLWDPAGERMR